MLRQDQIEIIRRYVPEKYFDQERLIRYLTLHDMVGVEVFAYVAKEYYREGIKGYETVLPVMFKESWEAKPGSEEEERKRKRELFQPETVDQFVRRIPFNFYHQGDDVRANEIGKEVQL